MWELTLWFQIMEVHVMNDYAWCCLMVIAIVATIGVVRVVEIICDYRDGGSEDGKKEKK